MSVPALLILPVFAACTTEKRHEIWRTLDPAGYKHTHSEVFNPKKYKRAPERETEDMELEMENLR
ncbi:hypothetical protein [Prosthecobacter sp.]|uniref:hypothetical protein n=1 Tax=Prosthecobacter sp. TaxID=1965333 RepID=UPI002AB8376E|nr:hypothetical protein [Prosthecobacter sp.]MDZ4403329.1 hypothetical protein [Prosthecobacter sp.]